MSLILFVCVVSCAATSDAHFQESSRPSFELVTSDGVVTSGYLGDIGPDWSMTIASSSVSKSTPGKNLVSLRRENLPVPPAPLGEQISLVGGDCYVGKVAELRDERLRFEAMFDPGMFESRTQEITVPLAAVSLLWWTAPEGEEDAELFRRRLLAERRRQDVLWLRNGDRVEGTLAGLTKQQVRVDAADGRQTTLDRAKVAVIALNTELARAPRPHGVHGRLVLANGSRITLATVRSDPRSLRGTTLLGGTVIVPVAQIVSIDLLGGCAVYLSDLKPQRYEHKPYLDVHWPLGRDGTAGGREIRLGGSAFDKGLGMHSESRATYDLAGQYEWFEALVGLDERAGQKGSVAIGVIVDGKEQNIGAAEISGQDPPRSIHVRIAGAKELTLAVLHGRGGDVQDHVDWALARIIKSVP